MTLRATADLDLRKLFREYDKMGKRGKNLRPAFRVLVPFMKADQIENFKRQEGPTGKWPPKAASTRAKALGKARSSAKSKGRRPPKRGSRKLLGKLSKSFVVFFDRDGLIAESKVPWSDVHQKGGTVGRGSKIPARVHHWMSVDFLLIAKREIERHVFGKFGRTG